jgi:fatty-acyl-CoA synthase
MSKHSGHIHLTQFSSYWAQIRGHRDAAVFADKPLSWSELNSQANSIANQFLAMGVKPGDKIGCLLENCVEYYAFIIAAWKCGAVFVPFNPRFGDFELASITADAKPAVIIATPSLYAKVSNNKDSGNAINLYYQASGEQASFEQAIAGDSSFNDAAIDGSQAGVIVYTSGTTGLPKGVCFDAETLVNMAFSVSLYANLTSEDRLLLLAPLAFGGGILCNLLLAYTFGSTLYIENAFEPARALALLSEEKISVFIGVPLLWQYMSQHPEFAAADLSELRFAVSGGAPVPLELLELYHREKNVLIQQAYGVTEFGGFISLLPKHLALSKPGCCGVPGLGAQVRVVDKAGVDCAPNEVGELIVAGSQQFNGYFNKPEQTAEAIVDGWYRSGDLGYLDGDGHIYIADRKKNMIITGGVNVYPAEVERALNTIPDIVTVAVLGAPSERWGEEVVAIVNTNSDIDAQSLRELSQPLLGDFKTPKRFIITKESFPLTPSGKIARGDKLREFYALVSAE